MPGWYRGNMELPYLPIRLNCLTVQGSFAQNWQGVEFTIRLIEAENLKLRKTIAGEFALQDLDEALAALKLVKQSRGWEKMVLIKP